ncbi:hypothetical protein KM043_001405 [Ampulex compressa]|nr:hypothetical protein KM043_001405 [Ampulex compressa]
MEGKETPGPNIIEGRLCGRFETKFGPIGGKCKEDACERIAKRIAETSRSRRTVAGLLASEKQRDSATTAEQPSLFSLAKYARSMSLEEIRRQRGRDWFRLGLTPRFDGLAIPPPFEPLGPPSCPLAK